MNLVNTQHVANNRNHVISSFIGWSLGISQNSCNPYFEQNIDQLN